MKNGVLSEFQKKAFRLAAGLALALHVAVILALIFLAGHSTEGKYKELAVMDFAYYDPEGGEPGGGDSVEPLPPEGPAPAEEPAPPEPEPEPEPDPEPEETPEVITTASEEAAPAPGPPPIKAKAKPKPKPKPVPAEGKPAESVGAEAGAKPGGGPGSGRGGVGGGSGQGNPKAFSAYTSKIRAKLNRLKKYPYVAASQRMGGVVTVNFTLDRGGNVTASHLVKGSGHPVLDQEAMALLKRASPFPAMPKEMPQSTLNLTVPIQFNPPR